MLMVFENIKNKIREFNKRNSKSDSEDETDNKESIGVAKRIAAGAMAVILGLSTLASGLISSNVLDVNATVVKVYDADFPRGNDAVHGSAWGHSALRFKNGWTKQASETKFCTHALNGYEGQAVYCIEPGVDQKSGDSLTSKDDYYWEFFPRNDMLSSRQIQAFVARIMTYGYQGNISLKWVSQNSSGANSLGYYMATQLLIWEVVVGERDSAFNHVSAGGYDEVLDQIRSNNPIRSQIMSNYYSIESKIKKHVSVPSFMKSDIDSSTTVELEWDGSSYSARLVDSNGVINNFNYYSSDPSVKLTVSGNSLIISTDTAPAGTVTITASKKNTSIVGTVVWDGGGGVQDCVSYGASVPDPLEGHLQIKVSAGGIKLVKTSEDGVVSGIKFIVTGGNINQTVTTDSSGQIQLDGLLPGEYTITELDVPRYEPQASQTVTVVAGQIATVNFNNKLKRGSLTVTKTSEDGLVEGMKFHLYGTSFSGLEVDEYATTDESGLATFKDVLVGTDYTLEEVETAEKYVIPSVQSANVEYQLITSKAFSNILKKFRVTVTKTDREMTIAQGNGTLAGAVYGIYNGDTMVDKYTTDANGSFTTDYYVCGDNWSIREITPSDGYLLDETSYHVGAEAKLYTIEKNDTAVDVTEQIIKGKISITKHTDDGETKIEVPEEGAEFEVYLKAAGSYEAAKETERDYLTCNEYGYAITKDLPYGVYTVHQVSGWEGNQLNPDFDVFINEDGKAYRYIINNATMKALIEIVKKDVETGKVIPVAGVGFKVRDLSTGEYIVQHVNYPTPYDVDVYYTDSTGKLMMPTELLYGKYELIEVQTAEGYVLDSEPVPFEVNGESTVVTVEKLNIAQKGKITVTKFGEVFSSVTTSNNVYQPVYKSEGLKDAVYEIVAAEDIITADGTTRNSKGNVVATITTGDDGVATTDALYLGKYEVHETKAPYGMVLSDEVHEVELVYAGQEVELTETSTSFMNERQRVEIDLNKQMEKDTIFNVVSDSDITNVSFGLYAAEDLVASDGTRIPKNGLIEITSCDESGKITFKTDLPIGEYYAEEYATDVKYVVSDTDYPVNFEYKGQDVDVVHISVNDGKAIDNRLLRGSVSGKKTDEDGNVVANAVFGLFKNDETDFTIDTAILLAKSDKNGEFSFDDVPYGTWVVRELEPGEHYALNETSYSVKISKDKEVIEIEIVNKFVRGTAQTTKVDADYPDHKLTGAVFDVYSDSDGDNEYNSDVDEFVGKMNEIAEGVYSLDDLKYGGYFLYESQNPDGYIKDDGYYYFEITKKDETVEVENQAGVGFVNQPIRGDLEITKKDIVDGKLLPNAGFRIKDEDGNTVVEGYTDENGIAKFKLRYGKYTYEEFDAPDGYLIDTTPHSFEITEDGQIIKAEMTNEAIPETGESNTIPVAITVGSVSIILCGVVWFFRKRHSVK